jgi:hypothetical protein
MADQTLFSGKSGGGSADNRIVNFHMLKHKTVDKTKENLLSLNYTILAWTRVLALKLLESESTIFLAPQDNN